MNSSSHSRQETCNRPYNSRRAKQISFCVCDQTYHYYIYGARMRPPTQSCHMGSIVISGGNHPGSMQFSFFAFWKLVCCWRDMDVPTRVALPPPPPPPSVFSWWILIFRTTKTKKNKIHICLCKPKKLWLCCHILRKRMPLNSLYLDVVFSRSPKYNRRFLKVFYFSLWSPSVFFPGEISPFFNKEIGNFFEIFFFLA